MNWLDIVLMVLILISVFMSFSRGFSREAFGLAATILGLLLGTWFYGSAGDFLLPYVSSKGVANFCGFLIVFFAVLLLGAIAGAVLAKVLKVAGLSWFDRLLGAGFGAMKGLLLGIALVMAMVAFTPGAKANAPPRSIVQSRLAPYMIEAASVVAAIAPYELKEGFHRTYDQVKKIWKDSIRKGIRELPSATV